MKAIATDARMTAQVRRFDATVELLDVRYNTLRKYTNTDKLMEYTIERTGDNTKFFGYGVINKLNVKLLDVNSSITDITTDNRFKVRMGLGDGALTTMSPILYVSEQHRDENTGELSITAYDLLYQASNHTVSEIALESYTIKQFADAIASTLGSGGITLVNIPTDDAMFNLSYDTGANFEGTETLRQALDAIAEATQSIYYMACNGTTKICFRRLNRDGVADLTIGKNDYITLDSKTNRRLSKLAHITELGDNVEVGATNLTITKQPASITAKVGDTVVFTVGAVGIGLTYQWQWLGDGNTGWRNTSLTGNQTNTITAEATTARNGYQYRCVITDANGNTQISKEVALYVSGITISKQPENFIANVGDTVIFSVEAIGVESYQWQVSMDNGSTWSNLNWTGAKTATMTRTGMNAGTISYQYRCQLTDASGVIIYTNSVGEYIAEENNTPTVISGTTQYIRNNPFYDLREDIDVILNNALANVGMLTINQFDCKWRGNYGLEAGDKLALITKDNKTVYGFLTDDKLYYNGSLSQETKWNYEATDTETASNPASLGDVLKQTYAKVDKANKQIELVASETTANSENISSLLLNTESITASVEKIEANTNTALENVNGDLAELTKKVETQITAEDVSISIQTAIDNGVDRVITSTGYTLDADGLTIEKSGSEMTTQITEDGMKVFKDGEETLTANNVGVNAVNLHATTYLIIGNNSRFEDYNGNRTGCFWIGGDS